MPEQSARRYELLYIIPTTFTDEEVGTVEAKVGSLLAKVGATPESTQRLGKLRFAYPIKDQRHGHYVLVMFTAEPSVVAKLDEQLRITSEVLRHLILSAEEAGSDAKYELVPFVEVDLNNKEDRPRRRAPEAAKEESKEEPKEGEDKKEEAPKAEDASKPAETV
ncbi:MAG TPA: 30S ribosomal protein S6 [Verrucomicrobiae bacterium]|nr:30S ribosomal protein S6 [Verrucomicrobiae bacterium]